MRIVKCIEQNPRGKINLPFKICMDTKRDLFILRYVSGMMGEDIYEKTNHGCSFETRASNISTIYCSQ